MVTGQLRSYVGRNNCAMTTAESLSAYANFFEGRHHEEPE